MGIRIEETDDGRYAVKIDAEDGITITFEQARRLREALQQKILRSPKTYREKIRKNWRLLKYAIAQNEPLRYSFRVFRDIATRSPLIQIKSLPNPISPEQYVRELDAKEQKRAREFWDTHL